MLVSIKPRLGGNRPLSRLPHLHSREFMAMRVLTLPLALVLLAPAALAQQPAVQPGPSEPDLLVILDRFYSTRIFDDLANPVAGNPRDVGGLFRKSGPGPVRYVPQIALGLEVPIHGGYYARAEPGAEPVMQKLWSYQHRSTSKNLEADDPLAPPLMEGSVIEFDPGDGSFGVYVVNDQFHDAVFSEPRMVEAKNPRLAAQPYKAMIYPAKDSRTGALVPNSYLIAWEYSTNDDFQDVVCRIDNVVLVRPETR
jgi:hypothetical protein